MHSIILIALSSPIIIGIYKDDQLVEKIVSEGKSSEILHTIFKNILEKYDVVNLIYAKGPGSFMAIKVSYIFLKTISIVKKINFLAVDAFYFNNNLPIKAVGKLCFVKNKDTISTTVLQEVPKSEFFLPTKLNLSDFSLETAPQYVIGAV
jgi:tRNA threonylcarbamoyladenosine biosynthesis protein TsaB